VKQQWPHGGRRPADDPSRDAGSPILHGKEGPSSGFWDELGIVRRYAKGALVYTQGSPSDRFYRLVSGRIRIYCGSAEGSERTLGIVEPGATFGEAACLDGLPHYATAVTTEPSVLQVLMREAVLKAMHERPDVMLEVVLGLTRKQRLHALQFEISTFLPAAARIAFVLSRLAAYYGETVRGTSRTRIGLRFSHEELAALSGTTRVTVTREIGSLVGAGILAREQRRLVVLDAERLLERAALP